jgi:hypothetical protein
MTALTFVVSSFFVGSRSVDALTYDYTNPYTTGCAYKQAFVYQTKYIYNRNTGAKLGYVQLWGSAYCHTAWVKVYMYNAAPYNNYGNALIHRSNGTEATCDSRGGNDAINRGQHSCYTPQIWDRDPYKSWGSGKIGGWGVSTGWY